MLDRPADRARRVDLIVPAADKQDGANRTLVRE
jgi:hypothetical protein